MTDIGPDALLSVRQTADRLGVGERTVKRLIEAGELGHVKVLRRTMVHPEQLADYMRRHLR